MIKRFLSLSIEKRARIIIWLYERYVMKPALEELEAMGIEFEPDFIIEDKPTFH